MWHGFPRLRCGINFRTFCRGIFRDAVHLTGSTGMIGGARSISTCSWCSIMIQYFNWLKTDISKSANWDLEISEVFPTMNGALMIISVSDSSPFFVHSSKSHDRPKRGLGVSKLSDPSSLFSFPIFHQCRFVHAGKHDGLPHEALGEMHASCFAFVFRNFIRGRLCSSSAILAMFLWSNKGWLASHSRFIMVGKYVVVVQLLARLIHGGRAILKALIKFSKFSSWFW